PVTAIVERCREQDRNHACGFEARSLASSSNKSTDYKAVSGAAPRAYRLLFRRLRMRTRFTFVRLFAVLLIVTALGPRPSAQLLGLPPWLPKLDPFLQSRVSLLNGRHRVIVRD